MAFICCVFSCSHGNLARRPSFRHGQEQQAPTHAYAGLLILSSRQPRQILVRQDPPFGWSLSSGRLRRLMLSARRSYLFFFLVLFVNHDTDIDDDMTCLPTLLSFPLPPFD
jgi:hypothetical protein